MDSILDFGNRSMSITHKCPMVDSQMEKPIKYERTQISEDANSIYRLSIS